MCESDGGGSAVPSSRPIRYLNTNTCRTFVSCTCPKHHSWCSSVSKYTENFTCLFPETRNGGTSEQCVLRSSPCEDNLCRPKTKHIVERSQECCCLSRPHFCVTTTKNYPELPELKPWRGYFLKFRNYAQRNSGAKIGFLYRGKDITWTTCDREELS
jgi:hypothetical protein